jgi:hypothetical protein
VVPGLEKQEDWETHLAGIMENLSPVGHLEDVRLEGMPRMADFAVWATAAEGSLDWEPGAFMAAYSGNRQEAADSALEADPVAVAVLDLMADRDQWTGSATGLWTALGEIVDEGVRKTKAWPGAPNALTEPTRRSDGRQHALSGISTTQRRLKGSAEPWRRS